MHPYQSFVQQYDRLYREGRKLAMGGFPSSAKPTIAPDAPRALIFSPHPDDECIIGGLPLRFLRQSKFRVINVAVTQGSRKDRQLERLEELQKACAFMGYELLQTAPRGLEKINRKGREQDPALWAEGVKIVAQIIKENAPRVMFFPHEQDWNSSHIGTHLLVTDALKTLPGFSCVTIETEYWGQNNQPNLMVQSSPEDVADMVAGTSFHVGEVTRNPFHLFIPAWMQENVRRGSELVGGQGEAAPDWTFATLYRLRKWSNGGFEEAFAGGRILPVSEDPARLL
jgi:LmbE family N-acetylglucosaminyl deacetylase